MRAYNDEQKNDIETSARTSKDTDDVNVNPATGHARRPSVQSRAKEDEWYRTDALSTPNELH
jgi:hypothetical protein